MNLKPYPKYKDSCIPWLGQIPEGWGIFRLGIVGCFKSSGIDKKIVEGEPLVKMVNYTDIYGNETKIIDANKELMTVSCPKSKIRDCNLQQGDMVFTPSSETKDEIGLSSVIMDDLDNTVFSYHVIRLRFNDLMDLNFKKYFCNSFFVLNQFSLSSKGTTRQILNRDDFKNILVVIPSIFEQTQIANYLDDKIKKIDNIFNKINQQIQKLQEFRQTLINNIITGKFKID